MRALQADTFAIQRRGSFRRRMVNRDTHSRAPHMTLTHSCRDTVSSIGILRGRSLPETTTGMNHVCTFRHALALDELRVKFLPEYANGGAGPDSSENRIKEVWFAGSHSDMYALALLCNLCPVVLIICSVVAETFLIYIVIASGHLCAGCHMRQSAADSRCSRT